MDRENYDSLKAILIDMGFGIDPHFMRRVEQAIENDEPDFTVYAETRFDDSTRMAAKLYIGKQEYVQYHQLTRYDARLYHRTEPDKNRRHAFLGQTFTFKEAFNLLQGRAVYKAFQSPWTGPYSAWFQLAFDTKDADGHYKFREYSQSYGFDLGKVLALYPIAELDDPAKKAALLASMKEGNLTAVVAAKATKTERWLIAANPQGKSIHIYPGGKYRPPADLDHKHEVHW